ncbi:IL10 protein, partial [Calcarius ornatus]|nr:IL10 protein [Calcarius ornatus]
RGTAVPILLLLLLLLGTACAQPSCLRFPELLPAKLKELRLKFEEIKDYFQSKDDDLSIQLLSSDLLEEIKVKISIPCWARCQPAGAGRVGSSSAKGQEEGTASARALGREPGAEAVLWCPLQHKFFTCEERSRSMEHVKEAYSRMKRNGIYKAMGEFDIFINYIERYLTMKRRN